MNTQNDTVGGDSIIPILLGALVALLFTLVVFGSGRSESMEFREVYSHLEMACGTPKESRHAEDSSYTFNCGDNKVSIRGEQGMTDE